MESILTGVSSPEASLALHLQQARLSEPTNCLTTPAAKHLSLSLTLEHQALTQLEYQAQVGDEID